MNYKLDQGKPRLDLVPPAIIEAVGVIRTYGIDKYGDDTWDKVEPARYRAALMRHLCEYLRNPDSLDEESGLPHLWHMACNVAFLCEQSQGDFKDKPVDNILSPAFWERFKNGNLAINCETEQEAVEFIKLVHRQGIYWINGGGETVHYWEQENSATTYSGSGEVLTYNNIQYFVDGGYTVVKYSEITGGNE